MANPLIETKPRKILGRKVKTLRKEGILPANLYGKNIQSQALEVPLKDFQKVYREVGETGLVNLRVNGQTRPVLIHNVQLHPVTSEPLHVDFHQVSLTEKTTATVSIELVGSSPAVEQKLGILIQPLREVEVEALPADLPERLIVDISSLAQVDEAATVADIRVDKAKVEIKAEPQAVVAKIEPLVKEEEVAPPPPPAEGVEAPVEEAAPAEEVAPPIEEGKPAEEKPKEQPERQA